MPTTQYVKLTARPDTWFKAGTEVYDYDCHPPEDVRRITLDSWNEWTKSGIVLARGIRVTEDPDSEGGGVVGEERWDGESCTIDEFDMEIVGEAK